MRRLLEVVALALVIGGCSGREQGTGDADPARIAPANAAAYFVADLQPPGASGEAAQAILARLGVVPNPDELAVKVVLDALAGRGFFPIFSHHDGPPLVGRRAALVVTGASAGDVHMAAILATTDRDKASATVAEFARAFTAQDRAPASQPVPRSYNGVDYLLEPTENQAVGLVDSFLVVGDEATFKAVVGASQGTGLNDHPAYVSTLAETQDAVASGYVDPNALVTAIAAAGSGPAPQVVAARAAASQVGPGPVTLALRAQAGQVSLSLVARGSRSPDGPNPPTQVVPGLPGDSWLVSASPRLGQEIRRAGTGLTAAEAAAFAMLRADLRRETGLDLYRDIVPAVGDVAFFVRGPIGPALRTGAVASTPSPVAARRLVARIRPYVARKAREDGLQVRSANVAGASGFAVFGRDAPAGVYVVTRGNRLVAAYGNANTRAALSPPRRLSDSPDFQIARASVSREPLFYLAFAPITRLLAGGEPEEREVARYFSILRTAAVSTDVAGGTETTRVVLTLR